MCVGACVCVCYLIDMSDIKVLRFHISFRIFLFLSSVFLVVTLTVTVVVSHLTLFDSLAQLKCL